MTKEQIKERLAQNKKDREALEEQKRELERKLEEGLEKENLFEEVVGGIVVKEYNSFWGSAPIKITVLNNRKFHDEPGNILTINEAKRLTSVLNYLIEKYERK